MNQQHLTFEQLVDYGRGELSARDDAAVHAHLVECADCAEAYDGEKRLLDLLRQHARAEEREMPPGLVTSIYARAADDRVEAPVWSWSVLAQWLRPAIALPIAAAIVLAIYVSVLSTRPPNAKNVGVDASAYVQNHAALEGSMPFAEGAVIPAMLTSDESP